MGAQTSKEEWQILQRMRKRNSYQIKVQSFPSLVPELVSQSVLLLRLDQCDPDMWRFISLPHQLLSVLTAMSWHQKILHEFVPVATRDSFNCYMGIVKSFLIYFLPFSKRDQAEVWSRFQRLLKLLLWELWLYSHHLFQIVGFTMLYAMLGRWKMNAIYNGKNA